LKNGYHQPKEIEPLPESPLILCDTSDASPTVTRPANRLSRKNYFHALCSIALARKVLNSAPKEMKEKSEPCIGIVTPYRAQAQLLQKLIKDAELQKQIQAGTVHRFQGLEFDVVIFDTVESHGMKPAKFISGTKDSDSIRLINVAVTRAKQKLIIVANRTYIQRTMPEKSTLRLAVKEASDAATVQSLDVVGIPFASFREKVRWQKPFVDDAMLVFNSANVEGEVLVLPAVKNNEDGDLVLEVN
jgi:superfamily I DNA and/or RNA helicase